MNQFGFQTFDRWSDGLPSTVVESRSCPVPNGTLVIATWFRILGLLDMVILSPPCHPHSDFLVLHLTILLHTYIHTYLHQALFVYICTVIIICPPRHPHSDFLVLPTPTLLIHTVIHTPSTVCLHMYGDNHFPTLSPSLWLLPTPYTPNTYIHSPSTVCLHIFGGCFVPMRFRGFATM
jgi:hypothetical protein